MLSCAFFASAWSLVILNAKPFQGKAITTLLQSKDGLYADLARLTRDDLKYIPPSFVSQATWIQWEKIKSLKQSRGIPPELTAAISEREIRETSASVVDTGPQVKVLEAEILEEDEVVEAEVLEDPIFNFNIEPFVPVSLGVDEVISCRLGGPNLLADRSIRLSSLHRKIVFESSTLETEVDLNNRNDLRKRAWNYLRGNYEYRRKSRILLEWAYICLICSYGLPVSSHAKQLILWLKSINIFNNRSQVPTEKWIDLLDKCKSANRKLWREMVNASVSRLKEDPDFDLSTFENEEESIPVSNLADDFVEGAEMLMAGDVWLPSLQKEYSKIVQMEAPSLEDLPDLGKSRLVTSYCIPFMRMDPPRISEIFKQKSFRNQGIVIDGFRFRRALSRQYQLLQGNFELLGTANRLLLAEWAMITIIFHGSNLPQPFRPFIRWLLSVPVFSSQQEGLKHSQEMIDDARALNPHLWKTLARIAAERFRADPGADYLPLLEEWYEANQIRPAKMVGPRVIPAVVGEIEDLLRDPTLRLDEILSGFREVIRSLYFDPEQIPHSHLISEQISEFVGQLK